MQKLVTILGGSGFIGAYLVNELAKHNYIIQIVSRDPEKTLYDKVAGPVGQVVLSSANVKNLAQLQNVIKNSHIVINLIGIMYEKKSQTFQMMHHQVAENIAKIAKEEKVETLIHFSALGIEKALDSKYAQSKLEGEKSVLKYFPNATIIRPSIVYGAGDNFFNRFAHMTHLSPFLPLIHKGKSKFQPIYAGDLAKAIVHIIKNQELQGKLYTAAGDEIVSFKEILQRTLSFIEKKRILLYLPDFVAKILTYINKISPIELLTTDQLRLLKYDNIIDSNNKLPNLTDLLDKTTTINSIVPFYLSCYK